MNFTIVVIIFLLIFQGNGERAHSAKFGEFKITAKKFKSTFPTPEPGANYIGQFKEQTYSVWGGEEEQLSFRNELYSRPSLVILVQKYSNKDTLKLKNEGMKFITGYAEGRQVSLGKIEQKSQLFVDKVEAQAYYYKSTVSVIMCRKNYIIYLDFLDAKQIRPTEEKIMKYIDRFKFIN